MKKVCLVKNEKQLKSGVFLEHFFFFQNKRPDKLAFTLVILQKILLDSFSIILIKFLLSSDFLPEQILDFLRQK